MNTLACIVLLTAAAMAAPAPGPRTRRWLNPELELSAYSFGTPIISQSVLAEPAIIHEPTIISVKKIVEVPKVVALNRIVSVPQLSSGFSYGPAYSAGWW